MIVTVRHNDIQHMTFNTEYYPGWGCASVLNNRVLAPTIFIVLLKYLTLAQVFPETRSITIYIDLTQHIIHSGLIINYLNISSIPSLKDKYFKYIAPPQHSPLTSTQVWRRQRQRDSEGAHSQCEAH